MEPGMKDLARFDSQDKQFGQDADPQFSFSPEFVSNCRMMTVMDFLTNNLDRHAHNVMYNPGTGKGLAIDHGRSFQYNSNFHNKWRDEPKKRGHDSLFLYMATGRGIHVADPETSEALNTIIHGQGSLKEMAHRRLDQLWSPVITDWWHDNSHRVKNAFDAHVGLIKDVGIREHISRNFDARWDYLNQLAEFGPNCIRDDWYAEPIKLHSYTGKWP
jgi:RNAse (barnase) inhibitor barstar